jgi:eukaryotic-like serine/threonine-protein kinase
VSQTGLVAYQTAETDLRSQLVWFDRTGKQLSTVGGPADQMYVELSADEKRVAVSMLDPEKNSRDLWTYDLARDGLRTRLTFDPADEFTSVWSPDASQIVFNSARKGIMDLYQKASNGAGAEDLLLADTVNNKYATSWSSNGRFVLYHIGNANSQNGNDLWALPLVGDRKPTPVLQTPFNETNGRFSPDGRWIAYMSDEAGPHEVYVMPFAEAAAPGAFPKTPAGKWQISTGGGTFPRWRRDGKELFYLSAENKLIAVAVNGQGSAFEVGAAHPLFEIRRRPARYRGISSGNYDVSGDGQRFLVNAAVAGQKTTAPITLVVNWPELLRK